jgi:prenyl protein peptidase
MVVWEVCVGLATATAYVAAVYALPSPLPRDHPYTIRRRIAGVSLATALALGVYGFGLLPRMYPRPWAALGLALPLRAQLYYTGATLAVFGLLFLGPIVQEIVDKTLLQRPGARSPLFWRNYVAAPATEELVFRACLIPLLEPALGARATLWLSPLFFGVAHVHHYVAGQQKLLPTVAMFVYTTVFGWLAAACFQTTRCALAAVAAHAFCNYMEVPDFVGAWRHRRWLLVGSSYVAGLLGFVVLGASLVRIEPAVVAGR